MASKKGMVMREFVIEAPRLLPSLVRPISIFFTFGCGCHTHPPDCTHPLKASFVTGVQGGGVDTSKYVHKEVPFRIHFESGVVSGEDKGDITPGGTC